MTLRRPTMEVLDLTLTQAIERYVEMPPTEAYELIAKEWPEQMAVLLVEFIFKTTCGTCGGVPDFMEIGRASDDSNYIVTLCSCETRQAYPPEGFDPHEDTDPREDF